jgi:archaellum component FlaF (FlaF/FlaG flagellin family)
MAEGSFPKVDGDILYASEANFAVTDILLVYTGTDLNVNAPTSDIDINVYEMTDITFGATTPDYIEILVDGTFVAGQTSGADVICGAGIKIEAKEIGGAYSTLINVNCANSNRYSGTQSSNSNTFFHTLTAGMKTNGVKYKITTTATKGTSGSASFSNRAIVFRGKK